MCHRHGSFDRKYSCQNFLSTKVYHANVANSINPPPFFTPSGIFIVNNVAIAWYTVEAKNAIGRPSARLFPNYERYFFRGRLRDDDDDDVESATEASRKVSKIQRRRTSRTDETWAMSVSILRYPSRILSEQQPRVYTRFINEGGRKTSLLWLAGVRTLKEFVRNSATTSRPSLRYSADATRRDATQMCVRKINNPASTPR